MSGSPAASSSITMHDVSASAPVPPRYSESASVRSPICEALSSRSVSSGLSAASRRADLIATGLTSVVTKSRTVSRISSCSGLRCRLYMSVSFSLDTCGLDHVGPLVELFLDVDGERVRVLVARDDVLLAEVLQHLGVVEERLGFLGQTRDDLLRSLGRHEQAGPGRHLEIRHRLGDRRHVRQALQAFCVADRKTLELAGAHVLDRGRDVVVHELHVAGDDTKRG